MNKNIIFLFLLALIFSCSHKKQMVYLNDIKKGSSISKVDYYNKNNIEIGDILKIDVKTILPQASSPYNIIESHMPAQSLDILILDGYLVDKDSMINYPVLGKINVVGFTENELSNKLKKMFVDLGHLTNPHVRVKKINSKFTVLGEVRIPGTYNNYDNQLNIFQAIGIAGDLLITAKRHNITLLREENGLRKTYKFSLNSSELLDKPYFYIKSNDVIIVEPNFSKIKSAGFIGSPASISSISSIILSITLLLINN